MYVSNGAVAFSWLFALLYYLSMKQWLACVELHSYARHSVFLLILANARSLRVYVDGTRVYTTQQAAPPSYIPDFYRTKTLAGRAYMHKFAFYAYILLSLYIYLYRAILTISLKKNYIYIS